MLKPEATNYDFNKTTAKELEGKCRRRGLKVGGRRDELFKRVVLSPGLAGKDEIERLSLLREKLGATGFAAQLSDVLTADAAKRLAEQWEAHKVDCVRSKPMRS